MEKKDITKALLLLHRNLAKELKKEKIFEKIVSILRLLVKCDGCAILMIENGEISVVASKGISKRFSKKIFNLSSKPISYIIRTGKNIVINDIDSSKYSVCIPDGCLMKSVICIPVKINGKAIGILHLDSKKKGAFTQQDITLVNLISSELSSVIERSFLYSELEQLSIKDPLTGCFNRRGLLYDIKKRIEECKRYKKVFSIIMIDLDNFKKYNDKFGHSRGDSLLKLICGSLRKVLRKADIMYRYGGDEFLLILPETNKEGAKICAKRLEEYVESMNKRVDKNTKISLSTGVAGYPDDAETPQQLIKVADREMYKRKFAKKTKL